MTFPASRWNKLSATENAGEPPFPPGEPAVVIAHDYLTQRGGAERVVLAMHRTFPEAPIYTTFYDPDLTFPEFRDATVITSPLNRIAGLRRNVRAALPLLPFIVSAMHVPGDVVLTSSTGWAHGFRTRGRQLVYCHSPARWLYLSRQYLGGSLWKSPKGWALGILRPFLRRWDQRAAARSEAYVCNSRVVEQRIRDVYGRDAPVLPPPHSFDTAGKQTPIPEAALMTDTGGFFLMVSRLLPYKNVQIAVEAFRGLPEDLLIIGNGPLRDELRRNAPRNVVIASDVTDAQMRWAYARALAVLAPSYEDFGITPLEGAAYGKPTIALRAGGYLDTVVEGTTGVLMETVGVESIREAVRDFRPETWDAETIMAHARSFSEPVFRDRIRDAVHVLWCSGQCTDEARD